MKKLIYILLITPIFVNAASTSNTCVTIDSDELKLDCREVLTQNSFDYIALNFCKKVSSAKYMINCLRAAANKDFEQDDINFCESMDDKNKAKCIGKAGKASTTNACSAQYEVAISSNNLKADRMYYPENANLFIAASLSTESQNNVQRQQHDNENSSASLDLLVNSAASGISYAILANHKIAFAYPALPFISIPLNIIRKEIKISYYESKMEDYADILEILKFARIGSGTSNLYNFYQDVRDESNSDLQYGEIDELIIQLDQEKSFCQNGKLSDYDELVQTITDNIKIKNNE